MSDFNSQIISDLATLSSTSDHQTIDMESLRVRLYAQLSDEGRVATSGEIAAELDVTEDEAKSALLALERDRQLALDREGHIQLAHPFATRDFGFSVKSDRVLWWGGCAWDSFAIPQLVPGASPCLVATTCPACGAAHAWSVDDTKPPVGDQVAHFLVPMAQVWDDVIHACENQRIFCGEGCVDTWLSQTGQTKGEVFSLDKLWKLASDWYSGRLSRGYQRREPDAAAAYFRDAGLVGSFWGS